MGDVNLKCQCGKVEGIAKHINPKQGTRVVCYCNSCQKFAQFLQPDGAGILDNNGGTDIYQTAPADVQFTKGTEHIKGIRLSPKGPHRWYADCCKTPIGNTASLKFPFVGLIHNFIDGSESAQQTLGPVRSKVHLDGAYGQLPQPQSKLISQNRYTLKFILKMLSWKFSQKGKTSPFYQANGKRVYPLETLNK